MSNQEVPINTYNDYCWYDFRKKISDSILTHTEEEERMRELKFSLAFIDNDADPCFVVKSTEKGVLKKRDVNTVKKALKSVKYYLIENEDDENKKGTNLWDRLYDHYLKSITYNQTIFQPCRPGTTLSLKDDTINLFAGYQATLLSDYDIEIIQPLLDHLFYGWCDEDKDSYEFLLDFRAYTFQYPTDKPPFNVVVGSEEEGVGKSIIGKFENKYLYGKRISGIVSKAKRITGRFNGVLENKSHLIFDDVGPNNKEKWNSFKAFKEIEQIIIERKGKDIENDVMNHCVITIYTTNISSMEIKGESDRNYFILQASPRFIDDVDYFSALVATLNQITANHYLTFLMKRDLTDFKRRMRCSTGIPLNTARKNIIEQSKHPMETFIEEYEWKTFRYKITDIRKEFVEFCKSSGHGYIKITDKLLKDLLKKHGIQFYEQGQGKMKYYYNSQLLTEEEAKKFPIFTRLR